MTDTTTSDAMSAKQCREKADHFLIRSIELEDEGKKAMSERALSLAVKYENAFVTKKNQK